MHYPPTINTSEVLLQNVASFAFLVLSLYEARKERFKSIKNLENIDH